MTGPLRAAVAGAGIGDEYVRALALIPGVEVVAVCARTAGSANTLADRHGVVGRYTSFEAMLEREAPALVVVATPNRLHAPMTLAAVEAGAHVVCEKPLALTLAQARQMALRAHELGRTSFVPFTWRFLPAARRAKELLDDGSVGTPYHVFVRYFVRGFGDPHGPMRWQFDAAEAGSGSLANLASHAIHLVHWWVGGVRRLCASLATHVDERTSPGGGRAVVSVDDTCGLLAELDGGASLALTASSVAFGPRVSVELGVLGSDGALVLDDEWGTAAAATGRLRLARAGETGWSEVPLPPDEPRADGEAPFRGCFARMAEEVVAAVREGRPASPGFEDGVRVQAVLEAALRAAAESSWVEVDDVREGAVR
jgi:predicted dehydrogenase